MYHYKASPNAAIEIGSQVKNEGTVMTQSPTPSRWVALAIGLLLVGGGLVGLLNSVPHFGDFAYRIRTESRELTPVERSHFNYHSGPKSRLFGGSQRVSAGVLHVDVAGFEVGAEASYIPHVGASRF
jgi:hypothetical protein